MTNSLRKSILRHALSGLGFWVVASVLFGTAGYLQLIRIDSPQPYFSLLLTYFVGWGSTMVAAPVTFAVGRYLARQALPVKTRLKHVLGTILLVYLWFAIYSAFVFAPFQGQTIAAFFATTSIVTWVRDIILLAALMSAGYAYGVSEKARHNKLATAELNTQLATIEAKLASEQSNHLRQRLGSHFVLNALSNIIALVRKSRNEEAMEGLYLLSDILRSIAHQDDDNLCSLEKELEFLGKYLNFQTIRYPALNVSWEIDVNARDTMLPSHILQPLVENAFKHGMKAGGTLDLSIGARRDNMHTHIHVTNSLNSTPDTKRRGEGQTLTELRLQKSYGADAKFKWSVNDGQYCATIQIPNHEVG